MAKQPVEFGIRIPDVFAKGFSGWFKNLIPLTLAAAATLGVYGIFRFEAAQLQGDDGALTWSSLAVDLVGLVAAGTIAYPWYFYALRAARGEEINLADPFYYPKRFVHQLVASVFFWAGMLLGVRWPIFGIPVLSLMVLVSYAFHGFVIADTPPDRKQIGGSYALGTSVRLGEKRRFGIFAVACLLALFNFFGIMFGVSMGDSVQAYAVAIAGVALTASVTLVGGAYMYDELVAKLPKGQKNINIRTRANRKQGKNKRG